MRLALILSLALGACSPALDVVTSAPGCEGVDFDSPPPERLVSGEGDGEWSVLHMSVFQACDAVPTLEVSTESGDLVVTESWSDGDDSCETCYDPQITVIDPPRGKYSVRWYLDGAEVPFDTVSFRVR